MNVYLRPEVLGRIYQFKALAGLIYFGSGASFMPKL